MQSGRWGFVPGEFSRVLVWPCVWFSFVLAPDEHLEATIQCRHSTTGNQGTSLRRFQFHLTEETRWLGLQDTDEQKQYAAQLQENQGLIKDVKGAQIPVVLERPDPARRETRLFIGGNWLNKGEVHGPGVPEVLNSYGASPSNRLDVAKWVASISTMRPVVHIVPATCSAFLVRRIPATAAFSAPRIYQRRRQPASSVIQRSPRGRRSMLQ